MNKTPFTIYLLPELLATIKLEADKLGMSVTAFIRLAVIKYINDTKNL